MKQKKFKIKDSTLLVYKSIKFKGNLFIIDTEPTTASISTTTNTSGIFNK